MNLTTTNAHQPEASMNRHIPIPVPGSRVAPWFTLLAIWLCACTLTANAQLPESIVIENENASATLRNLRWMTTQKTKRIEGSSFGQPVDPQPLDGSKLYPPDTWAYLFFDYELVVKESDDPKSAEMISVTISPSVSNRPTKLTPGTGTASIGVGFRGYGGSSPRADLDTKAPIKMYGKRKNGTRLPSVESAEEIPLKISVDGIAMISESQFEAIKGMYRRLSQLESRVKQLEQSQK